MTAVEERLVWDTPSLDVLDVTLDLGVLEVEAEPDERFRDRALLLGMLALTILVCDVAVLMARSPALDVRDVIDVMHTILNGSDHSWLFPSS